MKTTGSLTAGLTLAGPLGMRAAQAAPITSSTPSAEKLGWQVSCAQYTFRSFCLYETLGKLATLGISRIEPGFFLKLDKKRPKLQVNESLSAELRKELKTRLADQGIAIASFYAKLDGGQDAARKIFDFIKEMGATTLVGEPPAEAFDMLEKLCDEYEINLAVHNHPKAPKSMYWKPENVLAVCKGRGRRIGACCDTGHWVRSGLNPVECLKKMEGRIITVHLKDVIESGNPAARDVPLGTGKANYTAVLKELRRQNFRGVLSIEYEHDSPELSKEVAQCIAFVEKTVAAFSGKLN